MLPVRYKRTKICERREDRTKACQRQEVSGSSTFRGNGSYRLLGYFGLSGRVGGCSSVRNRRAERRAVDLLGTGELLSYHE